MKFLDYVFLIRPTLLIPGWTLFLIGYYRSGIVNNGHLSLAFITIFFIMGGVYVLNQIIDVDSDKINKKLYLLPEGIISIKSAWLEFTLLIIIGFLLSIKLSIEFKILLAMSFLFGILYSVPPAKFKARPIIDLLSNSLGYGIIAFSLGWVIGNKFTKDTILYALPYFFAVGGVFINTTIPDIPGDKKTNEITTGVLLGEKKSYILSTIFIAVSYMLSVILQDWVCGIASICALPLFILAAIKQNIKYCFISIRLGAPILVLLISIKFIWFIIILLAIFLSMRLYYKYRFNIIYPKIY